MKIQTSCLAFLAAFFISAFNANATTFVHLTAENATVDTSTNKYIESGVNYSIIYKPSPPATWTPAPWIDTTLSYQGSHSIGMEIDPVANPAVNVVDKV